MMTAGGVDIRCIVNRPDRIIVLPDRPRVGEGVAIEIATDMAHGIIPVGVIRVGDIDFHRGDIVVIVCDIGVDRDIVPEPNGIRGVGYIDYFWWQVQRIPTED